MKLKCKKCGYKNTFNPASILGSITSDKKAKAARENGKQGGRPIKPDSYLDGCIVTHRADAATVGKLATDKKRERPIKDSDITKAIAMLNNASSEVKPKIFRAKIKVQQQED